MMFGISLSLLITQCTSAKQPKQQKKTDTKSLKNFVEINNQKSSIFIEYQTEQNER